MVSGKLHNEGSGIAGKHLCLFKHNTRDYDCRHTYEICGGCNPSRAAEDSTCDHCYERNLSSARDKGCRHNRHTTVSFVFNRSRSHNTGNTATCAYKHRYERFTGKTEFTEYTVKHKCYTCHITASLKDSKQEEQNEHLRNKSENRADTGYDTVKDKTAEPICGPCFIKSVPNKHRNTRNPYAVC